VSCDRPRAEAHARAAAAALAPWGEAPVTDLRWASEGAGTGRLDAVYAVAEALYATAASAELAEELAELELDVDARTPDFWDAPAGRRFAELADPFAALSLVRDAGARVVELRAGVITLVER
jgi:hypothetical protein